eukprot:SAG31_NODE_5347_length_2594_cov_2.007615_1_plen_34_part_00
MDHGHHATAYEYMYAYLLVDAHAWGAVARASLC